MCGFQFDDDTNSQGDTQDSPGIQYGAASTATVTPPAPGVPFSDTTVDPTVVGGCPFCGTFNPTGKLLNKEFGREVDISNL